MEYETAAPDAPTVDEKFDEIMSNTKSSDHSIDDVIELQDEKYNGCRIFDICIGGIGAFICCILYPFISAGIKISSKGPVIYRQKRTGKGGESFVCYKFRTMEEADRKRDSHDPVVTKKSDSRIFPFGHFLRKTNLDELPQLFNVLEGDMSLVGPRPYSITECKYWNQKFSDHYYRYAVKPGLTGYAQIEGLRGGTLDSNHMRKRLDKDLTYIRSQSLSLDIYIVWHTLLQMLKLETNAH